MARQTDQNMDHRTSQIASTVIGQQKAESAATPRAIEYEYDPKNGNIILPDGAPFDGKPVLIKLSTGWCEAWWLPGSKSETQDGTEYEGFHWVCMDADFEAELDDARFWMILPQSSE